MDLRYPIGRYSPPSTIGRAELDAWIAELEALAGNLRKAVEGLSDDQLDQRYRPGGWTVRQVVHHIPDGHLSAYMFFAWRLRSWHRQSSRLRKRHGRNFQTRSRARLNHRSR